MSRLHVYIHDTHQRLIYADDINILVEYVHTVKENAEKLIVSTK
jgi:hypothetical protein